MKRIFLILVSIFLICGTVGCASATKKRTAAVSQGVYQVNESLRQGRVDLAKKYSDQLIRIVPPPAKKIVVKRVEIVSDKGGAPNQYIVLPQEYSGTPTINLGSTELNVAIAKSPTLQQQFEREDKQLLKYEETVDNSMRATVKEAEKGENRSWLRNTLAFLGIGGVIGAVVLLAFFPALIPVIISWFSSVVSGIGTGISRLWTRRGG